MFTPPKPRFANTRVATGKVQQLMRSHATDLQREVDNYYNR